MRKTASELCQSLAQQCQARREPGFSVSWFNGAKLPQNNWKFSDDQLCEFYELIVESCVQVIESEPLTDTIAAGHLRRRMLGK